MKRFVGICLLVGVLALDGCSKLGIGKQCYECTTRAVTQPSYPKTTVEICGNKEREAHIKANQGVFAGVQIVTTCTSK